MTVNGKEIANDIIESLALKSASLKKEAGLAIVLGAGNAATESFVKIKEKVAAAVGVPLRRFVIAEDATTESVIDLVRDAVSVCDAVVVQLPLPRHIDVDAVLSVIPKERDVDALNPTIRERIVEAPVARAVEEILNRSNVAIEGKRAVVIGAGRLVGAPVAQMLRSRGAQVTVVTEESGSLESLKHADIIVSGAGSPGLIKPDMIPDGVALIDAGTSEQGGKVVGDADPVCADKCSVFTPVPGGVGPVAVAMLFQNFFDLQELH